MKVTIINGSPRMDKGYTSQILEPLIEGMKDARAEVTLKNPKSRNKPLLNPGGPVSITANERAFYLWNWNVKSIGFFFTD